MLPNYYPVTSHTAFVGKGSTFVAINGSNCNGSTFIPIALKKGAKKIVVAHDNNISQELQKQIQKAGAQLEYVSDARIALAQLSVQAAGFPADKLQIYVVTGTKGKTTTAFLLRALLQGAGYTTALISTAHNYIDNNKIPSELTTPQPDYIHQFLDVCIQKGVTHVVMEVSAQALSLHRVYGILFDGLIFTNFSHEHLEFYNNLDDYFAAKKLVFKQIAPGAPCIVNADDEKGRLLLQEYPHAISYGIVNKAHQHAVTWDENNRLSLVLDGYDIPIVCNALYGQFNASNVLAATSLALKIGISIEYIASALATFEGVPGRLQEITLATGASVIIDYAHNPSSYEVLLSCLRKKTDQLYVVFGAGGGKDREKRPKMGAIAAEYADVVIVTSDNPRDEQQSDITHDIMSGIDKEQQEKVIIIDDRQKAIEYACIHVKTGAIIAILGKGNDQYQEIAGQRTFFSDEDCAKNTLIIRSS